MMGSIHLVGAGPGDPELLTLRAARRLAEADVILHDQLVSEAILALGNPAARRVHVGKIGGGPSTPQAEIEARMIAEAQAGHRVVRLKGGDPYVFGRGGEEALAAAALGIPVEVVPGISSALAGPAAAGIPVTHRGLATHFTVITGHGARDDAELEERWRHLARAGGTLVFLMGLRALPRIVEVMREAGLDADTPAAVIESATRPEQRVVAGTLATLVDATERARPRSPALIVIGEVVSLHASLGDLAMRADGAPATWPVAQAV